MASRNRPLGSLRSRVITGAAVGLVALGIWLGSWGGGFGLNRTSGTPGDSDQAQQSSQSADEDSPPHLDAISSHLDTSVQLTSSEANSGHEIVPVMIYGDGYRLPQHPNLDITSLPLQASEKFREATLEEALHAAEQTRGNPQGIHVVVLRHKSAKVSAGTALHRALVEAGFRPGQIHVRDDRYFD